MRLRFYIIGTLLVSLMLAFQNCTGNSITKRSTKVASSKEVKQLEVDPTPTPTPAPTPIATPTPTPTPAPTPQKGYFDDLMNFDTSSVAKLSIHDDFLGDITFHFTNSSPTSFSIGSAACLQNVALDTEPANQVDTFFSGNGLFDPVRLAPFVMDTSYHELVVTYANGSENTLPVPASIFPASYPEQNVIALLVTKECLSVDQEDISVDLQDFANTELERLLGDLNSALQAQ